MVLSYRYFINKVQLLESFKENQACLPLINMVTAFLEKPAYVKSRWKKEKEKNLLIYTSEPNSVYWLGHTVRAGFLKWTFWPARTKSRVVFDSVVIDCFSELATINPLPKVVVMPPPKSLYQKCPHKCQWLRGAAPFFGRLAFPLFLFVHVPDTPFPLVMSAFCFRFANLV